MNIQKTANQLTKEIKRNPAKAAVLGGLLLVAIWFWYPLIQKWMGSGSSGVASNSAENDLVIPQTASLPTPEEPVSTQKTLVAGKSDWQTIAQQISDDPWMEKGSLRNGTFDPFYPEQQSETILTTTNVQADETPELDVAPETAGLAVSSVIVGGRVPIARINNQNYRVGDTIRATEANIRYTLVEVHSWGVLLKGAQRVHQLTIDETPKTNQQRFVLRNGNLISPEN